jgi:hypothetical protein
MLVRKIAENHVSITVYKDGGFTTNDLDLVAEGYNAALSNAPIPAINGHAGKKEGGDGVNTEKGLRKDISSGPFGFSFHFNEDGSGSLPGFFDFGLPRPGPFVGADEVEDKYVFFHSLHQHPL